MTILTAECVGLQRQLNFSQQDCEEIRKKIQFVLISESLEDPFVYDIQNE